MRAFLNNTYAPLFVSSMPFKLGGFAFMLISTLLGAIFMSDIGTGLAQTTFIVCPQTSNRARPTWLRLVWSHRGTIVAPWGRRTGYRAWMLVIPADSEHGQG